MSLTRIEYPAWHDEARALKAKGWTHAQLADKYKLTASRMSQIATPSWRSYLIAFRSTGSGRGTHPSIASVTKDVSQYEFVPVAAPDPAKIEEDRRKAAQMRPRITEADDMSKDREFKTVKKMVEGKVLVGARIECSSCNKTDDYYNNSGSVNPAHLPKEFGRMGWLVAKSPRADKCPDCLANLKSKPSDHKEETPLPLPSAPPVTEIDVVKAKEPKPFEPQPSHPKPEVKETPMLNTVQPAQPFNPVMADKLKEFVPESPSVEPPAISPLKEQRETSPVTKDAPMSRTDRRIIFAELEACYGDETTGYKDDWDDTKVAAALGVPINWVKEVRDENFGPEISKAMRDRQKADVAALMEDGERLVLLIDKKTEQLQGLDNKLKTALEEIDRAIERAEQLTKSIEIEDAKMEELFRRFNEKADEFKKKASEFRASPSA